MSQENVERIRCAYEVFNRLGWESEEARRLGTELLHPDVEWHDQRELPGATVHHGIEGVEAHLAAAQEALEYETMDVFEVLDADPCVLVVYRVHAHGRLSGAPVERDAVNVYRFRGAKVDRVDIFGTRREALEAAGLSDQAMSEENLELMRRTFERWNAGEREADPEILDPEVVIHSAMTHATYHGYEGLRRWMAEIDHQFDDWNVSIDEFRDASEGRLLALGTVHVRGRTSGVAFDQPMALLLAFAEGRLIELRTIPDHAQALIAAGLSE